jgi:hypothetical protein
MKRKGKKLKERVFFSLKLKIKKVATSYGTHDDRRGR